MQELRKSCAVYCVNVRYLYSIVYSGIDSWKADFESAASASSAIPALFKCKLFCRLDRSMHRLSLIVNGVVASLVGTAFYGNTKFRMFPGRFQESDAHSASPSVLYGVPSFVQQCEQPRGDVKPLV